MRILAWEQQHFEAKTLAQHFITWQNCRTEHEIGLDTDQPANRHIEITRELIASNDPNVQKLISFNELYYNLSMKNNT